MNHNNIKLLMDHSLGESQNYHRPTEEELLEDYLNVAELLTINEERRLKSKIEKMKIQQDELDLMKLKHEKEMQAMNEKIDKLLGMYAYNPKLSRIKPDVIKRKFG